MGIFNRLGREVEQFKQAAKQSAEEHDYRCDACDARFSTAYDECPDCGADAVTETAEE